MVVFLQRGWDEALTGLVSDAQHRLVIASPFITGVGARAVINGLNDAFRRSGRLELLTDLSPAHVSDGALDISSLLDLHNSVEESCLWHVPSLHAKVYIADETRSIVTSGNLTANGLYRNAEYGVVLDRRADVQAIQNDFDDYRAVGTLIQIDDLLRYAEVASKIRDASARRNEADAALSRILNKMLHAAEDDLIRLKLRGGAVHTVFAKTVRYLLAKHGPMTTPQIHTRIRKLHPDLCDDSVDRVIDGKHFGRKWKHAVRTAQQQLKRAGVVEYSNGIWKRVSNE